MQAIVEIRWPVASLAGLIAALALFVGLPSLAYKQLNPQVSTITVDFRDWNLESPPAVVPVKKRHIKQKPIEPPPPPPVPLEEPEPLASQATVEPLQMPEPIPSNALKAQAQATPVEPSDLSPVPMPIFKLTALPHFAHKELPVYPPDMLRAGKEAIVQLEVLIDKEGKVREITILQSAGDAFDEAAKLAIRSSTFIPAQVAGEAVASLYRAPVTFKLR